MTPIQRLNSLVKSFPERDRGLAQKMLDERKFEDLWELVKSSIYMVRKYKDKYEAGLTDMTVFKSELSSYIDQLGLGDDEEELIDTYEEY
nr:MAG TPA: hypothetical protein [Crassvirales sp.]